MVSGEQQKPEFMNLEIKVEKGSNFTTLICNSPLRHEGNTDR